MKTGKGFIFKILPALVLAVLMQSVFISAALAVPVIEVECPVGTPITNGGVLNFGNAIGNSGSVSIICTITNTGDAALTLIPNTDIVNLTQPPTINYTTTQPSSNILAVSPATFPAVSSDTFTVTFSPVGTGVTGGTIDIYTNATSPDDDFSINLMGNGTFAPTLLVKDGLININSGTFIPVDIGTVAVGGTISKTFTIDNSTGAGDLILSGSLPYVTLTGTDYSISTPPSSATVADGATDSFIVSVATTTAGIKTGSISIASNDLTNPNYTFPLTATVTGPAMVVKAPLGSTLADNAMPAVDFGSAVSGSGSVTKTFTIQNAGTSSLTVSGCTAAGGTDYSVTTAPAGTVAGSIPGPAGATTFVVTFTPTSVATLTSIITIASDDPNTPSFKINVTGAGTLMSPPIYTSIPSAGSPVSMTSTVGTNPSTILAVNNSGAAVLSITPAIVITPTGKFTVTPTTATIAAGGSVNFTITCDGSAAGTFAANMAVAHDATGSPANYTLNCTVNAAPIVTAGVTLNSIGNITGSTALATATATGAGIGERGFYWWIPPTAENHFGGSESGLLPEGYGAGAFSLNITGLKPGNTYHLKTYVKVGGQIITSDEQLFTTLTTGVTGKTAPTVLTDTANYTVSGNSITVSGEITDVGASPVNVYGFVYAPHTAPFTGENMPATGDMAFAMWDKTPLYQGMKFTGTVKNIPPGKWYLRTYAHNANPDSDAAQTASLSYGEEISFTIACTPETCIPGDVNGDGKVDLNDAMLVLRILDGIPVGNINLNADVNGDGRIGVEELGYILQKAAGLR
ncbi:MAG: hypothetical protein BWK80_51775 [Desulfobacteraceae bacterium IS3]|nr:MAG: hypothetical protein BWK80_51775 [Desulfobacteraceae bacterium IS3]